MRFGQASDGQSERRLLVFGNFSPTRTPFGKDPKIRRAGGRAGRLPMTTVRARGARCWSVGRSLRIDGSGSTSATTITIAI